MTTNKTTIEIQTIDLSDAEPVGDLAYYCTIDVDGCPVGAMVGVPESMRETARKVGERGMIRAWATDPSDWAELARRGGDREAVYAAIEGEAKRLYREAADLCS